MEKVAVSRECLEFLVRETMSLWEFEGITLAFEHERLVALRMHEAIEALGIQEVLAQEEEDRQNEAARRYLEERERKAKEEAKKDKAVK
jgi:aspartate aminotransferase-like enzyme